MAGVRQTRAWIARAAVVVALLAPTSAGAATIRPTTTMDGFGTPDPACTLREAIESANQNGDVGGCTHTGGAYGADTIELEPAPYQLSVPGPADAPHPDNPAGDVDAFGDPLTIRGVDPAATKIFAAPGFRVIDAHNALNLENVRIEGANTQDPGGGIRSAGFLLTLSNVVVTDNTAAGGGGIRSAGPAILVNATVTKNTSTVSGGGLDGNPGFFELTNSTVTNNHAFGGTGGGVHGHFTVTNSTVANNDAAGNGGGLEGSGEIVRSTIRDNISTGGDGGGIAGFVNLPPPAPPFTITDTTISGNRAAGTNRQGGGIFFPTAGSAMTVANSTISGNRATGWGGGVSTGFNTNSTVNLRGVTINRNVANTDGNNNQGYGGGIDQAPGSFIDLSNTIVAGNTFVSPALGTTPSDCNTNPGASGPPKVTSQGHNLFGEITGCTIAMAGGDQTIGTADPLVAPLADNGGLTQTSALQPGSPAIDAGSPAVPGSATPACTTSDQRGVGRPQGPACDIGAYEYRYRVVTIGFAGSGSGSVSGPGIVCDSSTGACTKSYIDGTPPITLTASPAEGSTFQGFSGDCAGTECNLDLSADRSVTATFTGPPEDGGGGGDGTSGGDDGGDGGGGGGGGDSIPPQQQLIGKRKQDVDKLAVIDTVAENSQLIGQATVKVRVQKRPVKSRNVTADAAAGKPTKLRFKFAKRALRRVKAALADGARLKATIQVIATDASGNASTATKRVKLKR